MIADFRDYDLPPMSIIASRRLESGGVGCRYHFGLVGDLESDLECMTDRLLNRQVNQEITWLIEKQRMAEGPGWSRKCSTGMEIDREGSA